MPKTADGFRKEKSALILMVDDQIENLQMLGNILIDYKKAVATNGQDALYIAEKMLPDLILLDIMMPNIDGFEVCKKLKENEITKDIPIIFLTALNDTEILVKGFQLGGVDYITKPFKQNELLIRVQNHIELKRSRDIIIEQNVRLKNLLKDKNDIISLAAHDLKTPTTVIIGFARMVIERMELYSTKEIVEFADCIKKSGESMIKIISNLVDLNAIEENKVMVRNIQFNIDDVINNAIEYYMYIADEKKISITYRDEHEHILLNTDSNLIRQIIDNLLSNALKFSPRGSTITIRTSMLDSAVAGSDKIRLEVQDMGQGIKPEEMDRLFTKFCKLSSRPTGGESSTGLGLSIVRSLVEKLDGKVWCESEYGSGALFVVELPLNLKD